MPGAFVRPHPVPSRGRRDRPLVRNAAVVALRAALAIGVAGSAWASQQGSLGALLTLFAVWAAIDGACVIGWALCGARRGERCAPLLLSGVAGLAAAATAVMDGAIVIHGAVWLLACWSLAVGLSTLGGTPAPPRRGRVALVAVGAVSLSWGLLLLLWPVPGPPTLARWIAALALGLGVANAMLAWRLLRAAPHAARAD